jgi:Mg2+ and Co2+ transporter CorA
VSGRVLTARADGRVVRRPLPREGAARALTALGEGEARWRWVDLARAPAAEVAACLAAAGLPGGALAAALGAVGRESDGCGWLAWGTWGTHLALGLPGPGPAYEIRRSLHVLLAGRTVLTVRDGPWPDLARLVRALARQDAEGKALAAELDEDPWVLAPLLALPLVDRARRATRDVVDRGERIARDIVHRPARHGLWNAILRERRDLLRLRRRYAPLGRTLAALADVPGVGRRGRERLRELADRLDDSLDTMDMVREGMSSTAEAYASIQSNEINRVMKALTLVSVLFLPATLIASIYGMNFHIPEVGWPGGYAYSLTMMAVVTAALLAYLRRHGWL